jgi:hypothetical protein
VNTAPDQEFPVLRKSGPRGRWLTDQQIRESGRCSHGTGERFCGKPTEPGAPFGNCHEHAERFRETVRGIEQHERLNESAHRLERGYRAVGYEHRENGPDAVREVTTRTQAAERLARDRRRGRSR